MASALASPGSAADFESSQSSPLPDCFSCLDDNDSNVFQRLCIQIIRVTNQPQKLRKYIRVRFRHCRRTIQDDLDRFASRKAEATECVGTVEIRHAVDPGVPISPVTIEEAKRAAELVVKRGPVNYRRAVYRDSGQSTAACLAAQLRAAVSVLNHGRIHRRAIRRQTQAGTEPGRRCP